MTKPDIQIMFFQQLAEQIDYSYRQYVEPFEKRKEAKAKVQKDLKALDKKYKITKRKPVTALPEVELAEYQREYFRIVMQGACEDINTFTFEERKDEPPMSKEKFAKNFIAGVISHHLETHARPELVMR
jgi:Tfp pilus assembly protein PilE